MNFLDMRLMLLFLASIVDMRRLLVFYMKKATVPPAKIRTTSLSKCYNSSLFADEEPACRDDFEVADASVSEASQCCHQ